MKLYFLIFIICMSSCLSHNTNSINSQVNTINKKMDSIKNYNLNNQNSNFQEFWQKFRQTVIDSDSNILISLIHFPIIVHGDQDEDPQIKISKTEFNTFFKKFLQRSSFVKNEYLTNFEFIKRTQVVEKSYGYQETETWKRVGDIEFEKMNNNWKLTLLYFPTKSK